jgi:hypothetical protein
MITTAQDRAPHGDLPGSGRRPGRAIDGRGALGIGLLILGLALAPAARAGDEEPVPTNLELMQNATRLIAKGFIADFRPQVKGDFIRLRGESVGGSEESEGEVTVVENVLKGQLTYHGLKVLEDGGVSADPLDAREANLLRYEVLRFRLSYDRSYRKGLFGTKMVERRGSVRLYAELLDPVDGSVLWADEKDQDLIDRIPADQLSRVADERYSFANPEVPGRNLAKFVEPALVTGIVVGLVYLFFANQSES